MDLDTGALAHKRVLVAGLVSATLVMAIGLLFVAIPVWFIFFRHSLER